MSLLTPKFRCSYPNLFKPRLNKLNGKLEYSVEALFAPGDEKHPAFQKIIAAVEAAKEKKWGPNRELWPRAKDSFGKLIPNAKPGSGIRSPFKNQGDKAKTIVAADGSQKTVLPEPYKAGDIYLSLKSEQKPAVVDENLQPVIDPSKVYAGCFLVASLNVKAYETGGNCGVSLWLNNVMFAGDGDPLGSRSTPETDFAPIAGLSGVGSQAAPTAAADLFG